MSKAETITIPTKDLSGSRLRCLMLTSPPEAHVAKVLSMLVPPLATVDEKKRYWMPGGLMSAAEAKLGECSSFLTPEIREELTSWWLINRWGANTPNWDFVSACTIEGKEGLILVEAKAHDSELNSDGKSEGNAGNDQEILSAIGGANLALNGYRTRMDDYEGLPLPTLCPVRLGLEGSRCVGERGLAGLAPLGSSYCAALTARG